MKAVVAIATLLLLLCGPADAGERKVVRTDSAMGTVVQITCYNFRAERCQFLRGRLSDVTS